MEKNIKLNYVVQAFTNFGITSMWMLYLSYKGLNLIEIGILEALFHVSSFLFEVPSGALADVFGRKRTLILARMITIISSFILIFANSFSILALGFIIDAASYAFTSGSNDALVYDSLKVINKEKSFINVAANLKVLDEIVYNFGLVLAGILADIHFESVYIVAICFAILAILVLTQMKEPTIKNNEVGFLEESETSTKFSFNAYIDTLKTAFKVIMKSKILFYFLITSAIFNAIIITFFFYFQPYLESLGYLKKEISLLILISGIIQAGIVKLAPLIANKVKSITLFQINVSIISLLLLIVGLLESKLLLLGFILINCLFSLLLPILYNEIQQKIPSEQRATITSVERMFYSIMMIVLFPVMGIIGEAVGINFIFIILSICLIFLLVLIKKKLNKNNI